MIHKRSTALERSVNILLKGLNWFQGANFTLSSDVKVQKHDFRIRSISLIKFELSRVYFDLQYCQNKNYLFSKYHLNYLDVELIISGKRHHKATLITKQE